jgi:outer membrane protein assembly factor BamE (lipoprotein component of BamABCDE complex)
MFRSKHFVFLIILVFVTGCVTAPNPLTKKNSELTQGMVQMNLEVGKTSKAEVLETFGAPNITTRDGNGEEVWTYQRQAQASQSSSQSGYWTIILAGKSSRASGFETSSRMITLIIKFNNQDIVTDFNSRESNF